MQTRVNLDQTRRAVKDAINGKLLNERDDFKSHLVSAAVPDELRTGLLGLHAAK